MSPWCGLYTLSLGTRHADAKGDFWGKIRGENNESFAADLVVPDPEVKVFDLSKSDEFFIIASDGLWDVLNPRVACNIALKAFREGRSATQDIVAATIREMPICGVRDNITVIAIFLNVE